MSNEFSSSDPKKNVTEELRKAGNHAGESVEKLKQQAGEYVNDIKEKAGEYSDQVSEYMDDVSDYIKKCPMKSVLMAALAGAVITMVFKK